MKKLINKIVVYFGLGEYDTCPRCKKRTFWETFCNSCGYNSET